MTNITAGIPMLRCISLLCAVVIAGTAQPEERQNPENPAKPPIGRWQALPANAPGNVENMPLSPDEIAALEAIGYLSTTSLTESAGAVTVHEDEQAMPGYNLVMSGHAFETYLMDMEGEIVHRWQFNYHDRFSQREVGFQNMWYMAQLRPDGTLYVLQDGFGVFGLSSDSEFLWDIPCYAHHDFEVLDDNTLYVIHARHRIVPDFHETERVVDDCIMKVGADHTPARDVSILDALRKGQQTETLEIARAWLDEHDNDVLHLNSVEYIDRDYAHPAFKEGNLLISARSPHTVMVLDFEAGEIVWTLRGDFRIQHSASVLENGNILLFDNQGEKPKSVLREIDPHTGENVWTYRGTEAHPFYSAWNGRCHRLANGNTLVAESTGGRAFEVTRDKELVWEYWNPHRGGEDKQFIARIFELVRVPVSSVADWLPE